MRPTEEQIEEQISRSYDKDFAGMTYAEGVRAALEWMLPNLYDAEPPFED